MRRTLQERLAQLDSCAISDALDRLHLSGVVLGLHAVTVQKRVAGRVLTVQLEGADGRAAMRHLGTAAVDASGPGDVIVVAHGGRLDVSGWGGLLSLGATRRGIEGVIIDGACRDVDESRDLGLPLYARAVVPITARGRVIETSWNEPVTIGGVLVAPGDLVIADGSGVVFLAAVHAETILTTAEQLAAQEQAMAQAIRAGHLVAQVMGASYEELLSMKEE
jgi:4-hydroxy-4-methyl-2-oxoglutarate aldolase